MDTPMLIVQEEIAATVPPAKLLPELRRVKLSDVRFDQAFYPRKTHDPVLVQRYTGAIEEIEARSNFISVAADMTLVDGRHRHLAYLKKYEGKTDTEIPVFHYDVTEPADKFALAIELNSTHGYQLSEEDKRRCAVDLYTKYHVKAEDIAATLAVRKQKVLEWTKGAREEEERRENERIFDLYLACYTQEETAERTGIPRQSISRKLEVLPEKFPGTGWAKLSTFSEDDWKPPIYNVWTFAAKSNAVEHFGNTEERIVDNLLYLYTEPYDIVLDPFAGGGATIDACKRRLRRYWVSDRRPIVERPGDIRQLDIVTDLPPLGNRWSDVTLTYLDPPYWKQAERQYSKDAEDLANMPLEQFTEALAGVVRRIAAKQSRGVIALIIQPTQWRTNEAHDVTDHVRDLLCETAKSRKLTLETRVSCPYATEQYTPQMVDWAKANKKLLVLTRELLIWRVS